MEAHGSGGEQGRKPVEERHYTGDLDVDPGEGYRVEPYDPSLRADVLAMWEREQAMPPEVAAERIEEVRAVALHVEAGLVGVATAYLNELEALRMPMWTPRIFIARDHRTGLLGLSLAMRLVTDSQEAFVSGADERAQGILHVVENEGLRKRFNQAEWVLPTAVFIGVDSAGSHLRVHYFPGARVPGPGSA